MKSISRLKYVFIAAGLGILTGAFFSFTHTQGFLKNALTSDGTVVDLVLDSDTYSPVIKFITKDGSTIEFTSSSGSNPPTYSKGEIVEVFYQESSPEQAEINSFFSLWGTPSILSALSSVFFLVGFSILLLEIVNGNKVEYLRKYGIPIKATLQSVEINGSLEINGKSPFRICVQWINPFTSKVHTFYSENIWFDPTYYINTDEVTVLIERDNPKKYYVDISFLPEVAS